MRLSEGQIADLLEESRRPPRFTPVKHERRCPSRERGPAFCTCPEPSVSLDPAAPTLEIWLDGTVFARTQIVRLARDMFAGMTSEESGRRYGNRDVRLRVVPPQGR